MYDLIIKNGTVIDGTLAPQRRSDVAITDGKLVISPDLSHEAAHEIVDASGWCIAPGFIDVNTHADVTGTLLNNPSQDSLVRQGVTTVLCGTSGASLAPLIAPEAIYSVQKWASQGTLNINWHTVGEFLQIIRSRGVVPHVGMFVGHTTLRRGVVGDAQRALTESERTRVAQVLEQAMEEGALGLSTALHYSHARDADDAELSALLAVVARHNGTHVVSVSGLDSTELLSTVTTAIERSRATGVALHITHIKAVGDEGMPTMMEVLRCIADASQTIRISADVYPYTTMTAALYTLLPPAVTDGGRRMMLSRLRDASTRAEVIAHMNARSFCPLRSARVASSKLRHSIRGKTFEEMARERGVSVPEVAVELLLASDGHVTVFLDSVNEEALVAALQSPHVVVASNGAGYSVRDRERGDAVHPRSFGAFARLLGHYVRERRILSPEAAIHKITAQPAELFGLRNFGVLRDGAPADVVLFDPKTITDRATIQQPFRYAQGIHGVIVDGRWVMRTEQVARTTHRMTENQ